MYSYSNYSPDGNLENLRLMIHVSKHRIQTCTIHTRLRNLVFFIDAYIIRYVVVFPEKNPIHIIKNSGKFGK